MLTILKRNIKEGSGVVEGKFTANPFVKFSVTYVDMKMKEIAIHYPQFVKDTVPDDVLEMFIERKKKEILDVYEEDSRLVM